MTELQGPTARRREREPSLAGLFRRPTPGRLLSSGLGHGENGAASIAILAAKYLLPVRREVTPTDVSI
jgi:hypothetical protein